MQDITQEMLTYRECARSVWNTYFRELSDGWHEFINVNHQLFNALVLAQVFDTHGIGPVDRSVWVVPRTVPRGVPALWAVERDNRFDWAEFRLEDPSVRLRYYGFFDWADEGDYRDYHQVHCHVVEAGTSHLKGAHVLLETYLAEFKADVDE